MVEEAARERGWNWSVKLVDNPDAGAQASQETVATADSAILDRCGLWFNLAQDVIDATCPAACIIDLASSGSEPGN